MITKIGYKELLENLTLSDVSVEKLVTQLRVSTGITPESENDTNLAGTETETVSVNHSVENNKITVTATIPSDKFNGNILAEMGLITKTGKLFSRKVLPPEKRHLKTIENQVEITWVITAF